MKRILLVLALLCFQPGLARGEVCAYAETGAGGTSVQSMRRGINLYGWWEAGRRPLLGEDDFDLIKNLGFDFVRLPVDAGWLSMEDAEDQAETLAKLRCDIADLLKRDLAVIIDLHPGGEIQQHMASMTPAELLAFLENTWKAAAPALQGLPASRIALQLLNEPGKKLRPHWWDVQGQLVHALRKTYPDHLLIAGSIQNGPWNYAKAEPYADANVLYDFHYYQPMFLTHHAAHWEEKFDPSEKTDGIDYPVTNDAVPENAGENMKAYLAKGWNKDLLAREMASGLAWSKRAGAKLICLEFGVYRPYVKPEARANWLRDMREIFETNNIPWAVWEYNGGFGLVDRHGGVDELAIEALGLKPNMGETR
ncbi:MAG: cellulase family glycosylhydrolase [Alphaproteobacteria bacterium]|nr:cellulase family glycosylhydrolase [Alphaproteobacteria bacterium]